MPTRKLMLDVSAPTETELAQAATDLQTIAVRLTVKQRRVLADIALTRPHLLDKAVGFLQSPLSKSL